MSFSRNNPSDMLSPSQGYIDDIDLDQFTVGSLESTFHLENSPSFHKKDREANSFLSNESKPRVSFDSNEPVYEGNYTEEPRNSPLNPSPRPRSHTLYTDGSRNSTNSQISIPFESRHFNSLASHARTLSAAMALKDKKNSRGGVVCLREQEKIADELSKENFSLKLKVYHLEERLAKSSPDYKDEIFKENIAYKAQVKESINEVKRYRAQLLEARNFIEGIKKRERESSKCPLPHGMSPEQEKEFQLQVKKANKYRKEFKRLKTDFTQQDRDLVEIKTLLSQVKETKGATMARSPQEQRYIEELNATIISLQKEVEFYRQSNLDFQASSTRSNSRGQDSHRKSSYQSSIKGLSPIMDSDTTGELHQIIYKLEQDNANLENTQLQLMENINLYQEEITDLKQQLSEALYHDHSDANSRISSLTVKESQQAILLETLREQLDEARKRINKHSSSVYRTSGKSHSLRSEPTISPSPSSNPISQDLATIHHLCGQGQVEKALDHITQIQTQFQQLEVFVSELIDRLRYSTVVESLGPKNKLIQEEIQKLEEFCRGKFPAAHQIISLQEKIQVLDEQLYELEQLKNEPPSENPHLQETLVAKLNEREELLHKVYSGLVIYYPESKREFVNFDDFRNTLLLFVTSLDSKLSEPLLEQLERIHLEVQSQFESFNHQIEEKSSKLTSSMEKIDGLTNRYSELKVKALTLKSRLGSAKTCNEGYMTRIKELEGLLDSLPSEESDHLIDAPQLLSDLTTGLSTNRHQYQVLRQKYEQQSVQSRSQIQTLVELLKRTIQTLVLVGNRTPQIEGLLNDLQSAPL